MQVLDAQRLRIPDYAGNSMFNTLGNFEGFPHLVVAFVTGLPTRASGTADTPKSGRRAIQNAAEPVIPIHDPVTTRRKPAVVQSW